MGLGFEKRKVFVGIKDGKVQRKLDGGGTEAFDFIEGELVGISASDVEMKFGTAKMLQLELRDRETEEVFSLGTSLHGSIGRSIINSLSSAKAFGLLHIRPYVNKGGYNAVFITNDGAKLSWSAPFPDKKVDSRGNEDDTDRRVFTEELFREVREKFYHPGNLAVPPEGGLNGNPVITDDDVPF